MSGVRSSWLTLSKNSLLSRVSSFCVVSAVSSLALVSVSSRVRSATRSSRATLLRKISS